MERIARLTRRVRGSDIRSPADGCSDRGVAGAGTRQPGADTLPPKAAGGLRRSPGQRRSQGRLHERWPLALALLCAAGLASAGPLLSQAAGPCETDDRYRALDFLLGEWRLVSDGEVVGRSRAEKLEGGCLIAETWSLGDGRSGRTYSSFDPVAGEWRRFGVSNAGVLVSSEGSVEGDEAVFEGERVAADAQTSTWRERLVLHADGRIARTVGYDPEQGGASERSTTVEFDGIYEPTARPVREDRVTTALTDAEPSSGEAAPTSDVLATSGPAGEPALASTERERASAEPAASEAAVADAAAPAAESAAAEGPATERSAAELPAGEPAAAPAPVAETELAERAAAQATSGAPESAAAVAESEQPAPAAGEVTPASARAVDAAAIERIAMVSPMLLRVPLGAVESLPEGYAWVSRDTAPYLCEGVTIERVQVERRVRRGRVLLDVGLALHGARGSRRVSVAVDLRRAGRPDDDDPVASGAVAGRVGRIIPEQIEHDSVAFDVPLSMDAADFDEIVADAERPELVITLTVGR